MKSPYYSHLQRGYQESPVQKDSVPVTACLWQSHMFTFVDVKMTENRRVFSVMVA